MSRPICVESGAWRRALALVLLVLGVVSNVRAADVAGADVLKHDVSVLADGADRSAGTAGAEGSADYLEKRLAGVTGRPVLRQRFPVVVPVVHQCYAEEEGGIARFPLWPMTPAGGQNAAFKGGSLTAGVTYAAGGTPPEMNGKPIAGQIVAIEANSGTAWQTVAGLGAHAILFLADADHPVTATELAAKGTAIPVGVPRFYVDDPAAVAAVRKGTVKRLTLTADVKWEERNAANLVCLIPARQTTPDEAFFAGNPTYDREWKKQYVVLQAKLDASSQVVGRAPGAEEAISAAAVLDLADKIMKTPDHNAVLLVFTAGDEWNFRGTRVLLNTLLKKQADLTLARDNPADPSQPTLMKALQDAQAVLKGLKAVAEGSPAAEADERARAAINDELDLEATTVEDQLEPLRVSHTAGRANASELASLAAKKAELVAAGATLMLGTRDPRAGHLVKAAAGRLVAAWEVEVTRAQDAVAFADDVLAVKTMLGDMKPEIAFELRLTSHGDGFGFFSRSNYLQLDLNGKMVYFQNHLRNQYVDGADKYAHDHNLPFYKQFDPETMSNQKSLESYWPVRLGLSADAYLWHGVPAGGVVTVRDASGLIDTPADTPERIDWDNVGRQVNDLRLLWVGTADGARKGAITDPAFRERTDMTDQTSDQSFNLLVRTVGETIPRLGANEHLMGAAMDAFMIPLEGTRRFDWNLTRADGGVKFVGLPKGTWQGAPGYRLQAFGFDKDNLPADTLDQGGGGQSGLTDYFQPDDTRPGRAVVFPCRRLDLFGLFDPRYLDYLDKVSLLDARKQGPPLGGAVYAQQGIGAAFMKPDLKWMVLVSKGQVANRMVLVNADRHNKDDALGDGFDTVDLARIGPLSWRTVLDFNEINTKRREALAKFSISNDVVNQLSDRAAAYRADGEKARLDLNYDRWLGDAAAAWSLEGQVYGTLMATSNDIIHGVIFLLLGVIPFSYFLERLMIGSGNVYRQIGGFAGIFAVMTAVLWSFHPAFRISGQPLMILLAFLILILSGIVVVILFGKFEEEIARLRGAAAGSHTANLKRGTVAGAALRLGLSNMRRRGTRTTLTLLTLILLTFTLLCFTSVREGLSLNPQLVSQAPADPRPGILLHLRGWKPMPERAMQTAGEIARENEGGKDGGGGGIVARRWWYASQNPQQNWVLPVVGTAPYAGTVDQRNENQITPDGRPVMKVSGLLGLDPTEAEFQSEPLGDILPGWARIKAGQQVVILPADLSGSTLQVGDKVDLLGHKLEVAGFYDAGRVNELKAITGDSLLPADASRSNNGNQQPATGDPDQDEAQPEAAFSPLKEVAVVPAEVVRELGGTMTSVMIRPADKSLLEQGSPGLIDLAHRSAFPVMVSDGEVVRSYASSSSSNFGHYADVIVPIIIAGVIVLNTMLGAVSERVKEIHVYTSLGLAPGHVGALFLAEATALGTLGVVFGYVVGQGVATVLTHTHFMGGVELNYSSSSAIYTMGLVLLLVIASSLWPARMATRVAAPSLERDWKLPPATGDILKVDLPFTVNQVAARGVCAFLDEFFTTVTQTGTGRFTADGVRAFGRDQIRGVACRVWLAPYDLGVIQQFWMAVHPTKEPNVFEVKLTLQREAGNPATWQRLNRPFLVEVRKQFLLWRSVTPELVAAYVKRSDVMFAAARPEGPPAADPAARPARGPATAVAIPAGGNAA